MSLARTQRDALLIATKALPAAAANNSTDGIDLGSGIPDGVQLELTVPAVTALVDAKTIIYTFQDSADNSSFAAIAALATVTSTGAGGVGAAAVSQAVPLPVATRRYVRVNAAVLTAGGDNTAVSYTLSVKL